MRPSERERVQSIVRQAHRAGRDPIEQLDKANLLVTHHRYQDIRAQAFYQLALLLENNNITSLIRVYYGGNGNTAQDAQRAITAWVRARAKAEEEL
jgi:hypothetical protein